MRRVVFSIAPGGYWRISFGVRGKVEMWRLARASWDAAVLRRYRDGCCSRQRDGYWLLVDLGCGGEVAFEDGYYFWFVYGLGNVVVHAGLEAAFAVALHGVGRLHFQAHKQTRSSN